LAGPILIITGLGGAFGAILKASTLADDVALWAGDAALSPTALLCLGWAVAALMKTAQGSSTGALVIASGIIAPLLPLAGFESGTELALMTLAIGGGAMTISHANDSYFWVVTRFSGIEVADAYRSYTPLTAIMGLTVLVSVVVLSWLF
jgi:GntP family gluconate:H+ symporter